eukprot:gene10549-12272_t
MMNRKQFALILLIFSFTCAKAEKPVDSLTLQKKMDVVYGPYPRNIMDVYLPAGRSASTPFVLLIHGGAWTMAAKENIREYQDSLLAHGIAVASINHRYANNQDVHYPQMMEDVEKALNYCISQANQWNIRSDHFVLTGVSSGAHLALLYSYTSKKNINAIVEFCGPTDLTDTTTLNYEIKTGLIDVIQKMTGRNYVKGAQLDPSYADSSPVNHVKNIPVLIIHGDKDKVVPYAQSLFLVKELQKKGVPIMI